MATNDIGRVTPIWRGIYSSAAQYELNDIVLDADRTVWWHKGHDITVGTAPAEGDVWGAVIDMGVFGASIREAIETAQAAVAAAQEAVAEVTADTERAETAADNAENSAAAASESAAGVGALAQAAERSAEAAAGSATGAAGSAQAAAGSKSDAEAYAVGKRGGEDVGSTDPTYHNNAKYYAEQAGSSAEAAAQSAEDAQDVLDSIPEDYSQMSGDVGELKTQLEHVIDVTEEPAPIDVADIPNVETLLSYSARPRTSSPVGIQIDPMPGYTTYWFVATRDAQIYFDSTPAYTALTVATGFIRKYDYSDNTIALACQAAGTRYRTGDHNLPDQSNPVSVSAGDAIAVTITENTNVLLYGYATEMVYNPDEEFKEAILNDVKSYLPKKSYVQYNTHSGGTYSEYLSIYLPADNGYIRFEVTHDIDANIKSNIWRINNAFACDDNFGNEKQLTAGGEWELAIHLKNVTATGVNGFSGGIYHGKEVCDSVKFYLNGEEVDITTLTERTEFIRFTFNQTSSLYHPDDFTRKIAEHISEHVFNTNVTIKQSLEWTVAEEVTTNYMAMFPISKTYSNRFSTDASFIRAIAESGAYITIQMARKTDILSTTEGVESEFYTPVYPEKGADFFFINDNGSDRYNKCYYNITPQTGGYSVTIGEKWDSVAKYRINVM